MDAKKQIQACILRRDISHLQCSVLNQMYERSNSMISTSKNMQPSLDKNASFCNPNPLHLGINGCHMHSLQDPWIQHDPGAMRCTPTTRIQRHATPCLLGEEGQIQLAVGVIYDALRTSVGRNMNLKAQGKAPHPEQMVNESDMSKLHRKDYCASLLVRVFSCPRGHCSICC